MPKLQASESDQISFRQIVAPSRDKLIELLRVYPPKRQAHIEELRSVASSTALLARALGITPEEVAPYDAAHTIFGEAIRNLERVLSVELNGLETTEDLTALKARARMLGPQIGTLSFA